MTAFEVFKANSFEIADLPIEFNKCCLASDSNSTGPYDWTVICSSKFCRGEAETTSKHHLRRYQLGEKEKLRKVRPMRKLLLSEIPKKSEQIQIYKCLRFFCVLLLRYCHPNI